MHCNVHMQYNGCITLYRNSCKSFYLLQYLRRCRAGMPSSALEISSSLFVQERRLQAERTGRMIDLTKNVSLTVLAETTAKLDAEQNERDETEAQKLLQEAVRPYKQRLVRFNRAHQVESNTGFGICQAPGS